MVKLIQIATKLPGLAMLYGASILGIIQAILKMVKEILTILTNSAFPFVQQDTFKDLVDTVREVINKADEIVEKLKKYLLK